jgi:nucleotide-binding universal stress UspA family protein
MESINKLPNIYYYFLSSSFLIYSQEIPPSTIYNGNPDFHHIPPIKNIIVLNLKFNDKTPHMKTIIFPTDFSDNAEHAFQYAIEIAQKAGAELWVVNAYDIPYSHNIMTTSLLDMIRDGAETGVKEVAELANAKGLKVRAIAKMGNPIRVVKDLVKECEECMVVMGTKGSSGVEQILIGSNAAALLQSIKVPVLAIPHGSSPGQLKKIVFGTDYGSDRDRVALERLAKIAALFDAEVMVLHVDNGKEKAIPGQREKFEAILKNVPHSFHLVRNSDVEKAIEEFVNEHQADMVALLARNYSFIDSLFHTSVTSKVAYHTKVPYLALHEM